MRQVIDEYLTNGLSRRGFFQRMTALGFTAAAAEAILKPLEASEEASKPGNVPGGSIVEGKV